MFAASRWNVRECHEVANYPRSASGDTRGDSRRWPISFGARCQPANFRGGSRMGEGGRQCVSALFSSCFLCFGSRKARKLQKERKNFQKLPKIRDPKKSPWDVYRTPIASRYVGPTCTGMVDLGGLKKEPKRARFWGFYRDFMGIFWGGTFPRELRRARIQFFLASVVWWIQFSGKFLRWHLVEHHVHGFSYQRPQAFCVQKCGASSC